MSEGKFWDRFCAILLSETLSGNQKIPLDVIIDDDRGGNEHGYSETGRKDWISGRWRTDAVRGIRAFTSLPVLF